MEMEKEVIVQVVYILRFALFGRRPLHRLLSEREREKRGREREIVPHSIRAITQLSITPDLSKDCERERGVGR